MKRLELVIFIFMCITLSCKKDNKIKPQKLTTDSLTINSAVFDKICKQFVIARKNSIGIHPLVIFNNDSTGRLKLRKLELLNNRFYGISYTILLTEYINNDSATKYFWDQFDRLLCCDEDIIKLKQFNNIGHSIKSIDWTFFLYENILGRIWYDSYHSINIDSITNITKPIENVLDKNTYLKLDVAHDAAIWTSKY